MKQNQLKFLEFLKNRGIDSDFNTEEVISESYSVTFINPMTVKNFTDEYLNYLKKFDRIYSDGQLLTNYYSKNFRNIGRYSFDGNSIAQYVFEHIKSNDLNLALIGSTQKNVEITGQIISEEYNLNSIYTASGYDIDIDVLIQNFREKNIDVAVFGLGQVKQEKLLLEIKDKLPRLSCFTCGGYIHQVAGKGRLKYYPEWVNKTHLRAPYRVLDEGFDLLKRYLFEYSDFYKIMFKN
jgi:N-acetylglucosaminyldiphosphoundecaprenol N-acetyl-beta-D-mannosaminyltransferase